MQSSQLDKKRVLKQFDSFCKKVLSNSLKDIFQELNKQKARVTLFSDLSFEDLSKLYRQDSYDICKNQLTVLDYFTIYIENELLFEALENLKSKNFNVIVLSYWIGLSDNEISERLNMPRRTVTHIRNSTLNKIKQYMEKN